MSKWISFDQKLPQAGQYVDQLMTIKGQRNIVVSGRLGSCSSGAMYIAIARDLHANSHVCKIEYWRPSITEIGGFWFEDSGEFLTAEEYLNWISGEDNGL